MIVLGTGLTACLAGMVNQHATLYNEKETDKVHKAILRFPSPQIEKITGIPCNHVKISKSIFSGGVHHSVPNIALCNQYSFKCTGGYYDRSISNLDTVERWVPPEDFHERMLHMLRHRVFRGVGYKEAMISATDLEEPIVSTLPMATNCALVDEEVEELGTENRSIYVTKAKIEDCNIWHTMYFPEIELQTYRASIEGDILTIESIAPIDIDDVYWVADVFGVIYNDFPSIFNFQQKIGKITPIDTHLRKEVIRTLTDQYNIYSLGRWATWRSIQLEDVVKDIYQINRLINQSEYDQRVGK